MSTPHHTNKNSYVDKLLIIVTTNVQWVGHIHMSLMIAHAYG